MGIKNFAREKWNWLYVALSAIAACAAPSAVKADDPRVLGRLRPMPALEDTVNTKHNGFRKGLEAVEDFSEKKLRGIPQKYLSYMAAEYAMVLWHEFGHYLEAEEQDLDPYLSGVQPRPFWLNGGISWNDEAENSGDRARLAIAGFVNAGKLAEGIKRDILLGNVAPENLRIMSMLALVSELNLPVYLAQHYTGTAPGNGADDVWNFMQNTGIDFETMALSSGIHMLVNAPYMYQLTKNSVGSNSAAPKKKDFFLSFRYDGDSYMINFHSDLNTIIEKIPKPRFMMMHGEN